MCEITEPKNVMCHNLLSAREYFSWYGMHKPHACINLSCAIVLDDCGADQ